MAFKADITITGVGGVMRRLPATWQKFSDAAGKSLLDEGRAILKLAQQLAPVRTGALRRSGYAISVQLVNGQYTVLVGFSINYALIVHEVHPTRSKYLEYAYKLAVQGMKARLESNTKARIS